MNSNNIVRKKLDNGINVVACSMPQAGSVTFELLVGAGPRHEEGYTPGISHFLEHLLFEGTREYPTAEELNRAIEISGLSSYAYTTHEYMALRMNALPASVDEAVKFLHEITFNSLMTDSSIESEKSIVSQELRQYLDIPDNYIWDLLLKQAWGDHVLANNIIGTYESIESMAREELIEFLDTIFAGNNMTLVICGRIDPEYAFNLTEKYFSELKSGTKPKAAAPPANQAGDIKSVNKDYSQGYISVGYPLDIGESDSERYTLMVLQDMIGRKIFYKLVYELSTAYSAYCINLALADRSLLAVNAAVEVENTDQSLNEILDIIDNIPFDEVQLEESKIAVKKEFAFNLVGPEQYAQFIAHNEFYGHKLKDFNEPIKSIEKVSLDDIERIKHNNLKKLPKVLLGPDAYF